MPRRFLSLLNDEGVRYYKDHVATGSTRLHRPRHSHLDVGTNTSWTWVLISLHTCCRYQQPLQRSLARSMSLVAIGPAPEFHSPLLASAIPQLRAGPYAFGHLYPHSILQTDSNAIRPTKSGPLPHHERSRARKHPWSGLRSGGVSFSIVAMPTSSTSINQTIFPHFFWFQSKKTKCEIHTSTTIASGYFAPNFAQPILIPGDSKFYVVVADIQLNLRGNQNNQNFFASNDERNKSYIPMRTLQSLREVHHTDVPSASQKAYLKETRKATTWTSNFSSPRFKLTGGQLVENGYP
ncbi:hypothetical protein OPQ81_011961 [Rhizoctonia solani]|nr:hypothetical protein OPQ81_011961 [Rhizoctonia solani]